MCTQCKRLLTAYAEATAEYAQSVGVLLEKADKVSLEEFNGLRIDAADSWIDSEVIRLEVEKHNRRHRLATAAPIGQRIRSDKGSRKPN
jgi:hypothetical protein